MAKKVGWHPRDTQTNFKNVIQFFHQFSVQHGIEAESAGLHGEQDLCAKSE
jgi:hypothetical protein